jgi:hypothetical protein
MTELANTLKAQLPTDTEYLAVEVDINYLGRFPYLTFLLSFQPFGPEGTDQDTPLAAPIIIEMPFDDLDVGDDHGIADIFLLSENDTELDVDWMCGVPDWGY